nr:MAG TPA: hypothetical protein [Caudoviricetes sp.]
MICMNIEHIFLPCFVNYIFLQYMCGRLESMKMVLCMMICF